MANFVNGLFPGEIYPNETVAGCVDIFENIWPNPDQTIEYLEKQCADPNSGISWQRAETLGGGTNQDIRTNFNLNVTHLAQSTNNQIVSNIHNQFYMMLLASVEPYTKKFEINETLYHEQYSVLKYQGGQEYKSHYDGGTETGRSISAICYLNSDYVGGEIEFVNFGIKIKPEPGMLLIFPSNYAYSHIAHPVQEGAKYAVVTWIRDRYV